MSSSGLINNDNIDKTIAYRQATFSIIEKIFI